MNQLEQTLEGRLAQEARQRELLELYENEDWQGLLAAAETLNEAYSQQVAMTKWMTQEAADNLADAWEAHRRAQRGQDH